MALIQVLANINQLWFHKVMPYYLHQALSRSLSALLFLVLLLLGSCDNDITVGNAGSAAEPAVDDYQIPASERPEAQPLTAAEPAAPADNVQQPEFSVEDDQYMIDVSKHTQEEFFAFLKRADEIATLKAPDFDQPNIALILHGEDIDWFTKRNYEQNKELVDLAARLDALEVIDLKISEKAMADRGYAEEDIPAFIDRVPFGPDEMQRLQGSGSFQL